MGCGHVDLEGSLHKKCCCSSKEQSAGPPGLPGRLYELSYTCLLPDVCLVSIYVWLYQSTLQQEGDDAHTERLELRREVTSVVREDKCAAEGSS